MSNGPSPKCPQCGAALAENALAGLCPNCLMALNLKTETVSMDEPPSAQPPLPPGQIAPSFPHLEILECLGRGGMGVVYKARQKSLNRLVALKLLAPERVNDPRFAERFAREAQALAALNHPNIVTIHDFGQAGGFYFLLMEFVDGLNLRQLMRTRKLFKPEEALAIVPSICEALQYAHERGIVHRDIKPENLLLDKQGKVKIADFGIAKMLGNGDRDPLAGVADNATQSAFGTPGYSAPEQKADPRRADNRADIYSLGVVFYEMLTGELPGKRIEPPSRKVHIDIRLDAVVLRALEKTPELRWQTAADLRTQVETITSPPTDKTGISNRSNVNSRFSRTAVAGIVCLVLLFSFAALIWPARKPANSKENDPRPLSHNDAGLNLNQPAAPRVVWNTNSPAETWHPAIGPGEKPNLTRIRNDIDGLILRSNYADALQHQIWYFNHALENGEIDPVRLSFGMMGWQQLVSHYPAARQALTRIRNRDIQEFKEAASYTSWAEETKSTGPGQIRTRFALFNEIHAINDALEDNDAQAALTKLLIGTDPKLARTMGYKITDDAFDILEKKSADGEDVGDGQAAFKVIRQRWEALRKWEVHMDDVMARAQKPATQGMHTGPPGIQHSANSQFVDDTRELIKILVAHNHKANAENIRLQALALLDNPWLNSAVSDAQAANDNQTTFSQPPATLAQLSNSVASNTEIRHALIGKQAHDTEAFSEGHGNLVLFQELYNVNGALGDDDATYTLFQNLRRSNPDLAGGCYQIIEPLLVRRGDYRLCLELIGNPETEFQIYSDSFEMERNSAERAAKTSEQLYKKNQASLRQMGRPFMAFPHFNAEKQLLNQQKTYYVLHVCRLVEILVGTGHDDEAEFIRDKAVAICDDPRLQSAVSQAEEHIKNPKAVPSFGEIDDRPSPLFLSGLEAASDFSAAPLPTASPPARIDSRTGLPAPSGRATPGVSPLNGMPNSNQPAADRARGWPFSEMEALYMSGQFDEALRRFESLSVQITNEIPRREMFGLWIDVAKKFPPAREALIGIRNRDVGEFSGGGGSPDLFWDVKQINDYLRQTNQTYALFKSIYNRDGASATPYFWIEEDDLIRRGEYAICLQFYEPQSYLNAMHTNLDFMRKQIPLWRDNQKKSQAITQKYLGQARQLALSNYQAALQYEQRLQARSEQFRQDLYREEITNFDVDAWDVPTSPPQAPAVHSVTPLKPPSPFKPPSPPDLGATITNAFVRRVDVLVQVMVGAGHRVDAEKIRDQAMAICDDPRIESAVYDADQRIAQHSAP